MLNLIKFPKNCPIFPPFVVFFVVDIVRVSAVARGGAGGARAPPVFFLESKNRPV